MKMLNRLNKTQLTVLAVSMILIPLAVGVVGGVLVTRPTRTARTISQIRETCTSRSELATRRHEQDRSRLDYSPYEGLMYVKGAVVITGDPSVAQTAAGDLGVTLTVTNSYRFAPGDQESEKTIGLYQIEDDRQDPRLVELTTCMINEYLCEGGTGVCADPNYHLSPAWAGSGSPWTQNGEWVGLAGGGLGEAPSSDFKAQWAFGEAGINLFELDPNKVFERTVDYTGGKVRIGVFDTSPFEDGEWKSGSAFGSPYDYQRIPWADLMKDAGIPLTEGDLVVWHYDLLPAPDCPGVDADTGTDLEGKTPGSTRQDLSNHGLFVASLAHTVAPHSEIYLVRVLENDACGDLYSIAQGIRMFMEDALRAKKNGDIGDIVLNLSLGVHQPPNPSSFGLPEKVYALQDAIDEAIDKGAIVVAAAGNDSFDKAPNAPNDMEIPAIYPKVIGVAASNPGRGRGCFSNRGDVAAPGGEGLDYCNVPGPISSPTPGATPTYACQKDSSYCVVSLVRKKLETGYGYAYWPGTSFSTPLVSGLTALVIEKEWSSGVSPLNSSIISAQVLGNACPPATTPTPHPLGSGIINLPHALNGDPCPTPPP